MSAWNQFGLLGSLPKFSHATVSSMGISQLTMSAGFEKSLSVVLLVLEVEDTERNNVDE